MVIGCHNICRSQGHNICRSQGHSSRCLVKAEENLFEYKQRTAGDNAYMFLLHAKLSYVKHS